MADARDAYGREFVEGAAERIRDYLDYHGYPAVKTDRYRGCERTWHECPCCGSGSGNNGHYTPAFNVYRGKRGDLRWGCFACAEGQRGGDIFDLAAHVEGARTWREKEDAVARFLGVEPGERAAKRFAGSRAGKAASPQAAAIDERADLQRRRARNAAYVKECMAHAHETDFFRQRGFTDETVRLFHLGYDPRDHAAVIPYVDARYHAVETYAKRNTRVAAGQPGRTWKHKSAPGCKKIIFNMEALARAEKRPVFIAEAPMDAMSIEQAGGYAIALGGTHNANLFEVIDGFSNRFYALEDVTFVLALDADAPGDAGAEVLAGELAKRGILCTKAEHPCFRGYHDPNEVLMNDPALLEEAVRYESDRAERLEALGRDGGLRPFGRVEGGGLDGEIRRGMKAAARLAREASRDRGPSPRSSEHAPSR